MYLKLAFTPHLNSTEGILPFFFLGGGGGGGGGGGIKYM